MNILVLNLIITGIPSIPERVSVEETLEDGVLNLIITGIPSIHLIVQLEPVYRGACFKPYYNWNTFNTIISAVELCPITEF